MKNLQPVKPEVRPVLPEDPQKQWPPEAVGSASAWLRKNHHLSRKWVVRPDYDTATDTYQSFPKSLNAEDLETLGKMTIHGGWVQGFTIDIQPTGDYLTISLTPRPREY